MSQAHQEPHVQENAEKIQETELYAQQEEKSSDTEKEQNTEVVILQDKLLRAHADKENMRKRYERDIEEARNYGVSNLAKDLVDVLDNLYRAHESLKNKDIEPLDITVSEKTRIQSAAEGIDMTIKLFETALAKYGIKRIFPEAEQFDHRFHEALSHTEAHNKNEGEVIKVVQAGYTIHERLLRPALVVVAKITAKNE